MIKVKIFTVKSVGKFRYNENIITIFRHGQTEVFELPVEYDNWVNDVIMAAWSGNNLFPCQVEFGYIIPENRYYADMP